MEHTVLIVEDEPAQAEVLSYNLESAGFRIMIAVNGEEGLLLAQKNVPDAIILDWIPLVANRISLSVVCA